jgi:hypothetical protein
MHGQSRFLRLHLLYKHKSPLRIPLQVLPGQEQPAGKDRTTLPKNQLWQVKLVLFSTMGFAVFFTCGSTAQTEKTIPKTATAAVIFLIFIGCM